MCIILSFYHKWCQNKCGQSWISCDLVCLLHMWAWSQLYLLALVTLFPSPHPPPKSEVKVGLPRPQKVSHDAKNVTVGEPAISKRSELQVDLSVKIQLFVLLF
jgi:hypothetical protein